MEKSKKFYTSIASILDAIGEISHDGDFDRWDDSWRAVQEIPSLRAIFTNAAGAIKEASQLTKEDKEAIDQAIRNEIVVESAEDEELLEQTVMLVQQIILVVMLYSNKFRKNK